MTGFGNTSRNNNVMSGDRDCRPGAISEVRNYPNDLLLQITAEQKELRGMYFDLYILCYISYLSNSRMKTLLSRMSSNRRVKRDDHEPEEEDDEHMGDSEEEAESEFFERNTNEFKCKKGQEQYVYVSKNHLSVKKYLLQ